MNVTLRPGNAADAQRCGEICYNAFKAIAEQHNFPPDFPSPEVATGLLAGLLAHPGFYSVVAEIEGKIVGSNFLDERSIVAGLGPITVDPYVQNRAIGRHLMQVALDRVKERRFPGVRLLQAAYHNRSLSLYARLGFVAREPLSTMQGSPPAVQVPGYGVRPATELDLDACNQICVKVHGHDRAGELLDAIKKETATVVEHAGRITGYASSIAFFGHAVGETNEALKALIGAAPAFGGPGFLVPTRNAELFRWCLENGLRIVQPMTLMSRGLYSEPIGAFLPSVLY
ncbi:MAG: GNAT family N-acetyltransferase [Verrucomicrobia bacterium]|nr:MAG: GNAT family N-acetyltransferase [Verrucomicrobiota bacterium]